jgi:hypothetical protein
MVSNFVFVILGGHREVPRVLCSVALSFLSVHVKEPVALRNTRGKQNAKVTRTARGSKAAVPAVF